MKFRSSRIESQVSAVVWDASIVLARYLIHKCEKSPIFLRDKHVLELGSGLGLCGMTASVLGAKTVLMTDLKEAIRLLEYNVDQNKEKLGSVEVRELTWSKEEAEKLTQDKIFDYVLISDCIYYEESIEPLIETLDTILKGRKTVLLLAQELRESEKQIEIFKGFIKKARDKIVFREVPLADQDPDFHCEEIMLYHCTTK